MTERPTQPTPDPLIDEVRAARRELSERFGNDVRRLAEHLREIQRCSKSPVRPAPSSEQRSAGYCPPTADQRRAKRNPGYPSPHPQSPGRGEVPAPRTCILPPMHHPDTTNAARQVGFKVPLVAHLEGSTVDAGREILRRATTALRNAAMKLPGRVR
jgi:hypothetical protein